MRLRAFWRTAETCNGHGALSLTGSRRILIADKFLSRRGKQRAMPQTRKRRSCPQHGAVGVWRPSPRPAGFSLGAGSILSRSISPAEERKPLPRLFISHSSKNDDWAIALQEWMVREGWSGKDDIFLDFDPERGIAGGERWARALEEAATRCEAVLFLVSEDWLASKWCADECQLANKLNKKLFALLIDDVSLDRLPGGFAAQWQVVRLTGEPAERFLTVHPRTQHQSPVWIAEAGLKSLKRGLEKVGIGAETFELQPAPNGPFGWRTPYRGLEALEPEDAAVFFGRSADIARSIDALRGLASRRAPRLLVILGASGTGKSSFLRA